MSEEVTMKNKEKYIIDLVKKNEEFTWVLTLHSPQVSEILTIYNNDKAENEIGCLYRDTEGKVQFRGNVEDSAKGFFEVCKSYFDQMYNNCKEVK